MKSFNSTKKSVIYEIFKLNKQVINLWNPSALQTSHKFMKSFSSTHKLLIYEILQLYKLVVNLWNPSAVQTRLKLFVINVNVNKWYYIDEISFASTNNYLNLLRDN